MWQLGISHIWTASSIRHVPHTESTVGSVSQTIVVSCLRNPVRGTEQIEWMVVED